jgi:hypothetical protein
VTKDESQEPEEATEPYERGDFFRDLKKASRKLEPGENPDPPKRPRPSERSGETA